VHVSNIAKYRAHTVSQPDPLAYLKVLELLKLNPQQCCMVAAHAYDLRAAKKVWVQISKTMVYIMGLTKTV
jgi:FMN phosphatase YigB (HAD superfamily)